MIGFWKQLKFLLWKGYIIKKRQKFWLAVELLVPIVLFAILAAVRTRDFTVSSTQCHYDSKGFPSAGLLPFLHSFLCSFSNECHTVPTTGDEGFYINPATSKNESILIDVVYYGSLQLDWIGNNPTEFAEMRQEFTKLIKIAANLDMTSIEALRAKDFLAPSFNAEVQFPNWGVSQPMTNALLMSTPTPYLFLEGMQWGQSIQDVSYFDLLIDDSSVPFLCNRTIFQSSFILPPNASLADYDYDSLCNVTSLDLLDITSPSDVVNSDITDRVLMKDGSSLTGTDFKDSLSRLNVLLEKQPLREFVTKWMEQISETSIREAIFCGSDPLNTPVAGLTPPVSGVETPFDKMRENLIKFISDVIPGQDKHDKKFCGKVPIHDDLNCSSFETALFRRFRPLLQGYILVTPKSPAVEQLIQQLNKPLQSADFLRRQFYEWPSMADDFQMALHQSDFYAASVNILRYMNSTMPPVPYPAPVLEQLRFALEHLFNEPSDPYSFGAITKNATEIMNQYTTCFLLDRFIMVESNEIMEQAAVCLMDYEQYFTGISFENMTNTSTHFDHFTTYRIRHQPDLVDSTPGIADSKRHPFSRNMPFNDLKYITYGFSFLQEAVDRAIISMNSQSSTELGVFAQQEPYPCVETDKFNVSNFIGLFVILSFIIPASLLVKNIVFEKEQKLKEQMRIMGLGDIVHFVSWAIISFLLNFISVVVICCILKFGRIYDYTDISLLIVFLTLFAMASISMSLLLSTFFTNANISTAATCITYFLFFFPFQLSVKSKNKTFSKFTLIFPQTTVGYGMMMLAYANEAEEASWSNLDDIYLAAYGVSLLQCLIAFVCESVGFCVLAWYISGISPGVYGVSQPWYFPLTRRYWFANSKSNEVDVDVDETFDSIPPNESFETEPVEQKMAVNISNLCKIYDSGTKALNKLNLRLYESNITALLGHNGAGKTTTMSMLCGLYSPSSGTASVYGRDIRKDMRRVRDVLGVCPQYNVLFDLLTVIEQLRFFAALKGTAEDKLDEEAEKILASVCLTEKRDSLAGTLSGGMKRRLCIGIALIGDSKFVILDEPTAGVDVNSRKDIWRLLQNNKEGRTILLSTHHMDEADVLSDRVAVLSEGSLVALGSPVFLKNRYGDCMQLVTCKTDRSLNYAGIVERILVSSQIKLAVLDETDDEIVFSIPISTNSTDLQHFFEWFDTKLETYKISDYGISAPTLQQIFIRLAPQREYIIPTEESGFIDKIKGLFNRPARIPSDEAILIGNGRTDDLLTIPSDTNLTVSSSQETLKVDDHELEPPPPIFGWEKTKGHIHALFSCRWQYTKRSKKTTFFEVILPVLLLLACEVYALIALGGSGGSAMVYPYPLPLVAGLYGNTTDTYVNVLDRNETTYSYRVMKSLVTDPGMGTRCARDVPPLGPMLDKDFAVIDPSDLKDPDGGYAIGCYPEASYGSFNWTTRQEDVNYNEALRCECSANVGWNCTQEDYPLWTLDHLRLNTTERIWDMSYKNISQMRLATRWTNNATRDRPFFKGGFSMGHVSERAKSKQQIAMGQQGWTILIQGLSQSATELRLNLSSVTPTAPLVDDPFITNLTMKSFVDQVLANLDVQQNIKVWFNNKLWPSLPIYASSLSNALLRIEQNFDVTELGIITINQPMNQTVSDSFDGNAVQKVLIFRVTIVILVLAVIPAGFTVFLVQDRISDSYHLQLVSGLAKKTYWMTGFAFDMIIYCLAIVSIMLIYLAFGVKEFTYHPSTFFSFLLLFILYGMAAVLWAYCLQRYFTVPALSFVLIAVGTFFVGTVGCMTVTIIEQLMQTDPTLETAHTVFSYVLLVLPQFCLGMAVFRGSYVYQLVELGKKFLVELNRQDMVDQLPLPVVLEWNLMGMYCFVLFLHCILASLLLAALEHGSIGLFRRREKAYTKKLLKNDVSGEDEDVRTEQERVNKLKDPDCPLMVNKLAKAYSSSHLAVRGISFAVEKGECFGLLGLNGAGKTTTFGMLTGKIQPGDGIVNVNGCNVGRGDSMGYAQLGYCPQFDALNGQLTTKENLIFFSRIRGIPESHIGLLASRLLKSLHLRPYANVQTNQLSGGNKRKLSVAIALISQPALILLDEPSAGMDPGSQQFLWKVIERLRKSGKAVVMTSHSMEECEALCTRIAIMDKGKIRCLGSKQHLKTKFGEGYSMTLKMRSAADTQPTAALVMSVLVAARLEAVHCATIFFHVDPSSATIASILAAVNQVKQSYEVEDFSLSQATLAEVFQSLSANEWKPLPTSDSVNASPSSANEQ